MPDWETARAIFYLAPEKIGGLPFACDQNGNPILLAGAYVPVKQFKDAAGRVKRQAARFKIFKYDDAHPQGRELALQDEEVARIEWSVHLANKTAAWYEFKELCGDTMLGQDNTYQARKVPYAIRPCEARLPEKKSNGFPTD